MTGDLGPGESRSDDLSAVFGAYLVSAAGLAAQRDDDTTAALLGDGAVVEASVADLPVTSVDGHARVAVDLVLQAAGDVVTAASDAARQDAAAVLNEVVEPDGYHVHDLRLTD